MAKEDSAPMTVTDLEAIKANAIEAVEAFAERWISMPRFTEECVVMDQSQLRDAMGLRAVFGIGDPWPAAEKELLERQFRWHPLGCMRVMYLKEREDYEPDDGWERAEEI
jgi:hypothetical protein